MTQMVQYDFCGKCNKISELIDKLNIIKEVHGDLDLSINSQDDSLRPAGLFEVYDDCMIIN